MELDVGTLDGLGHLAFGITGAVTVALATDDAVVLFPLSCGLGLVGAGVGSLVGPDVLLVLAVAVIVLA